MVATEEEYERQELNSAELFEVEESGQFTLGVDGEQRSLEGLAAAGKPAPLNHTPERTAAELAEELAALTIPENSAHAFDAPWHPAEPELEEDWLEEDDTPEPPPAKKTSKRTYSCACCGKTLKNERWIFSRHTNARYCWPGECRGERKGR